MLGSNPIKRKAESQAKSNPDHEYKIPKKILTANKIYLFI